MWQILGVAAAAWWTNFRTQEQRTNLGLPHQKIRCPDCLGKVPVEAKKCMHCGCSLSSVQNKPDYQGSGNWTEAEIKGRKECKSCSTSIPIKAQKCIHCGANQPLT